MLTDTQKRQGQDRIDTIAVIICSFNLERYKFLKEAIQSLLNQNHLIDEIGIIISGSKELKENISRDYNNNKSIHIVFSEKPLSATQARNRGIQETSSDILLFTDDDVIAHHDWVKNIMDTYTGEQVLGVGGKILPEWLEAEPQYLPEELYWLVGVTHKSYLPDGVAEIRNAFGPNMSFRRVVFEQVGSFNEQLGFADEGRSYIQGEEPEFGIRMFNMLNKRIIYNPNAIVYHKIPPSKLKLSVLFRRSFYQGYTKSLMPKYKDSLNHLVPETNYFKMICKHYIPERIKTIVRNGDRMPELKKLCVLHISVMLVGIGYLYGLTKNNLVGRQK